MDELGVLEVGLEQSSWHVADLFVGHASNGRRLLNPVAKLALIERLRGSRGSLGEAARANGISRQLLKRWVVGKSVSHRKAKVGALLPVVMKPPVVVAPVGGALTSSEMIDVVLARGSFRLAASPANLERLVGLLAR